jgi:hypothetical protein
LQAAPSKALDVGAKSFGMRARDHLDAVLAIAMQNEPEIHEKWIVVTHRLMAAYGAANFRMASDSRTDLLLRQLEKESLQSIGQQEQDHSFATDFLLSLSALWVISSYEICRSCYQAARTKEIPAPKLKALREQLSLVRTPLVKYEIDKTNRKKPVLLLQPQYSEGADNSPRAYETDGTYIMPMELCRTTGAVIWYPIDMKAKQSVPVCRRDLSDAFLALFD